MLRLVVALLLLANLLFFAWARGSFDSQWPAPDAGEREPGRLAQQVRPESVVILSPRAAAQAAAQAAQAEQAARGVAEAASAPEPSALNVTAPR